MTRRLSLFLLSIIGLAVTPVTVSAQQRAEGKAAGPSISADGTEVFQYLLDRAKLQPIKSSELWNIRNNGRNDDVIVIVLGDPLQTFHGQSPLEWARIATQNGGAALVASDTYVNFANSFANAGGLPQQQTTIPGDSVYGGPNTAPTSLFLGRPSLPFLVPCERPRNGGPEWDVFDGLKRIATNQPSYILAPFPRGEFGSQLATFPDDCRVEVQGLGQRVDPDTHFFAVGGSGRHRNLGPSYRFMAMSDPSVFINQMMLAKDEQGHVDNLELAARTIGYLSEEEGRKRTRCLLFQNGQIVERFDGLRSMMQPPLPLPNIMAMQEKLTDFANKVIDQWQENDISNKIVVGKEESERNRRFRTIMEFILAMLAIRAGWYLLKRIWIARRPADGPAAIPGGLPLVSKGERPAGVFDRRQRELLRRNNLYEPVRVLIREMFAEAGAPTDAGKKLPKVIMSDVVARRDTLHEALSDLWKIAYGVPRVVTVQRWRLLEPLFERVRQAHADGKWRFA